MSFCYNDEKKTEDLFTQKQHLEYLKNCSKSYLNLHVVGIDRGVKGPVQSGETVYDLTDLQKKRKIEKEKKLKRYQRKMARQKKAQIKGI